MSKKMLFSLWLCMSIFLHPLSSQHKELAVDRIPQRAGQWCWAASMDMVMDYQLSSYPITQCDLVGQYLSFDSHADAHLCPDFCSGGEPCDPLAAATSGCNQFIPFTSYPTSSLPFAVTHVDYDRANIDALFTQNGFFSMEDHMKLSWEQYKEEIDMCRPVIFLYNVTGRNSSTGSPTRFNHAVVAKGYTSLTGFSTSTVDDYFMIEDPWEVCAGEEYLLSKSVLSGGVPTTDAKQVIRVNGLLSMVHHLAPKTVARCEACELIPEPERFRDEKNNTLMVMLRRFGKEFLAGNQGALFKEGILAEYPQEGHYSTQIHYMSYDYFSSKPATGELNFEQAVLKTDVREVVYTKSDIPLYTRVSCSKEIGLCAVETIGLQKADPTKVVIVSGDTIQLSNDPAIKGQGYSILRCPPYTFEFYRFEYNNQVFYYPVESNAKAFFYGVQFLTSQRAIPERQLLVGLATYTQEYEEAKLVGNDKKYWEKMRAFLQGGGFLRMGKLQKLNKF